MPFTITDPTGQVREAVAPDEAADAVIAIGWDDKGWPREKGSIGWAVVYGLQDGTLHVSRGLSYAEARRVVRFRWDQMTDEVIAGLRVGVRKVRGRWVLSERCPDGVVRTFTASDKPGTSSFRRPIAAQVRFSVLERDGFRCRYCGEGSADARLHVDHVKPVSKGGTDDLDNLVTACEGCNLGKLDREGVQVP